MNALIENHYCAKCHALTVHAQTLGWRDHQSTWRRFACQLCGYEQTTRDFDRPNLVAAPLPWSTARFQ